MKDQTPFVTAVLIPLNRVICIELFDDYVKPILEKGLNPLKSGHMY